MLFMHEVHRVHGKMQDEFEELYRERWMPLVAKEDGVRLLWYFNVAHGSGMSYQVVTITAARDWTAWERFAQHVQEGPLREVGYEADTMRYGVQGKVLVPTPGSPLQDIDLDGVGADTSLRRPVSLYIEDTIQPDRGTMAEAVAAVDRLGPGKGTGLTRLTATFRPSLAGGRRREIVLLQNVLDWEGLARFFDTGEVSEGAPWSGGHRETPFTDTWETRFLRTAPWSPLDGTEIH